MAVSTGVNPTTVSVPAWVFQWLDDQNATPPTPRLVVKQSPQSPLPALPPIETQVVSVGVPFDLEFTFSGAGMLFTMLENAGVIMGTPNGWPFRITFSADTANPVGVNPPQVVVNNNFNPGGSPYTTTAQMTLSTEGIYELSAYLTIPGLHGFTLFLEDVVIEAYS